MPPEYVRPSVKAQKNDERDAEAATRPTMRFVPLKGQGNSMCRLCIGPASGWLRSGRH